MQYIVIPASLFSEADPATARRLALDCPRHSLDGSEIIMHIESFHRLFPAATFSLRSPYPVYESGDPLDALLQSPQWMPQSDPPAD